MTDPRDTYQAQENWQWGAVLLGCLCAVSFACCCSYQCGMWGSGQSTVAKFNDRWVLKSARGLYVYKPHLCHLNPSGEEMVVLSNVTGYAQEGNLVFFLTTDTRYAVLNLESDGLREFDRVEDAPQEWRESLKKIQKGQ
jgi:hypothetical protein